MTLTEFLTARLDEDEAAARTLDEPNGAWEIALSETYGMGEEVDKAWDTIAPTRRLADVAAKRRIVAEARDYSSDTVTSWDGEWAIDLVLRLLALPYADHPDYNPEWSA